MLLSLSSTAIPKTESFPVPPIARDHTGVPSGGYLAKKASSIPLLLRTPPTPPKSTVPENDPATSTLPLPSVTMALPISAPVPPNRSAHLGCPVPAVGHVGVLVLAEALIPEMLPALSTATRA